MSNGLSLAGEVRGAQGPRTSLRGGVLETFCQPQIHTDKRRSELTINLPVCRSVTIRVHLWLIYYRCKMKLYVITPDTLTGCSPSIVGENRA